MEWIDMLTHPPQHPRVPIVGKHGRLVVTGTVAEVREQFALYPCDAPMLWKATGLYKTAMEEMW